MTMFPSQNRSKQNYSYGGGGGGGSSSGGGGGGGYGGCCGRSGCNSGFMRRLEGYECCSEGDPMAEDESRTDQSVNNEGGSSSKEEKDDGWLQLSIGGHVSSHESKVMHNQVDDDEPRNGRGRGRGLIELDLFTGGTNSSLAHNSFGRPEFIAPPRPPPPQPIYRNFASASSTYLPPHHETINWPFRPISTPSPSFASASAAAPPALSLSSLVPQGSYLGPQTQPHLGIDVGGPSLDFRVVDPPRRPHSGVWFTLQASQIQAKEPFLPQISRSYLRIKDGRMTVRLLMKYLVNKLRLESESEIEITCRGQQLLPFLTLQHVRDNVWSRSTSTSTSSSTSRGDPHRLLPVDCLTTDHIMVLHYGRSAAA